MEGELQYAGQVILFLRPPDRELQYDRQTIYFVPPNDGRKKWSILVEINDLRTSLRYASDLYL